MLKSAAFTSKLMLLELFLDERKIARQLRSSQLLRSSFASHIAMTTHGNTVFHTHAGSSMDTLSDMATNDNPFFNKSTDLLAFAAHEQLELKLAKTKGLHFQIAFDVASQNSLVSYLILKATSRFDISISWRAFGQTRCKQRKERNLEELIF